VAPFGTSLIPVALARPANFGPILQIKTTNARAIGGVEGAPNFGSLYSKDRLRCLFLEARSQDIIMPALDQGIKRSPTIAEEEAALYWMFQVVAAN
jgi:hypothetical protein